MTQKTCVAQPMRDQSFSADPASDDLNRDARTENERNFDAFFNSIDDLIFVLDEKGDILFTNDPALQKLGYERDELNGMNVLQVHPPELRAQAQEIVGKMIAGTEKSCPLPLQTRDGRRIPVETRVVIGKWSGRNVLFGISKDLTELTQANEKFQKAFYSSPSPMAISEVESGRYLEVNQAFLRLLGYGAHEVIGHTSGELNIFTNHSDRQRFLEQIEQLGHAEGEVARIRTRTGRELVGLFSGDIITLSGKDHLLTLFFDLTDRIRSEEALQAAKQAAESSNEAKSRFLANMSHELRTPMSAIIGFLDLMMRTGLTGEQTGHAQEVRKASEHMLTLINNILDLSKVEAGKTEIVEELFHPDTVIHDAMNLVSTSAAEKGLQVQCIIDAGVPKTLFGDVFHLRQILNNLLGNAVKFTDHGFVAIHTRLAHEAGTEQKSDSQTTRVLFEITDTGIGMSTKQLSAIFQPFTQADETITRRFGGTGLGLSISLELARMLGGDISVDSRQNGGSTFRVTLPFQIAQAELEAKPLSPSRLQGSGIQDLRILVVEDNLTNQKLITQILSQAGLSCDLASNGMDAIEACRTSDYHIIFMDCQMPVMDGLAATRVIRDAEKDGRRTKIVALTAGAMIGDRERCMAAGMDGYICKPFTVQDIYNEVIQISQTSSHSKVTMVRKAAVPVSTGRAQLPMEDIYKAAIHEMEQETGLPAATARSLILQYMETLQADMLSLRRSEASCNDQELRAWLHRHRGVTANLRLKHLNTLILQLESMPVISASMVIELFYPDMVQFWNLIGCASRE